MSNDDYYVDDDLKARNDTFAAQNLANLVEYFVSPFVAFVLSVCLWISLCLCYVPLDLCL